MNVQPSRDLLRQLAEASGPPGAEQEVREIVKKAISPPGEVSFDRLGSILCEKQGSSSTPRVAVEAHLDEVGFMVQSITSQGFLRFIPLGGWWGHVLPSQRVDILTESGKIPGIIGSTPPHFLSPAEREKVQRIEDMLIDVGAGSESEIEAMGIRVGDPIAPHSKFVEMAAPDILSCKAFDNRVGVGSMCETMNRLTETSHPNTVIAVGAVQEEVGCRGAITATEMARPDVALILEGTPADDVGPGEGQGVVGKGPQVRLFDPTAISNRRLVRFMESVAKEVGIDLQLAVRRSGGTDAKSIHVSRIGVPTVVIGVPARYIHTHVSLIHWRDYKQTIDLTVAAVERLDEATVNGLVEF